MAGGLIFAPDGGDDAVVTAVAQALARQGQRRVAIAGGATPAAILPKLTTAAQIDWEGVLICPTDDRIAPEASAASNVGALRRAFAQTKAGVDALQPGPSPGRFDLVWLGLGADGHIASLFPAPAVPVSGPPEVIALTPQPLPREAPFARITLNYAAIADAEKIILVARGAAKRTVLDGPRNDLPIWRLVAATLAPITVFWTA